MENKLEETKPTLVGFIGKRAIFYTKCKCVHNGKKGYWSWLETFYYNSGEKKKSFLGWSATKKSVEKRATKMFEELKERWKPI